MSLNSFKPVYIAPRRTDVPIVRNDTNIPIKSATSANILNWDSPLSDKLMTDKRDNISKQLNILTDIFNEQEGNIYTVNGRKIINITKSNDWFRKNVAFIFSTGKIFNNDDRSRLDNILALFQSNENYSFLTNSYKLLDYKQKEVVELEKSIHVSNGNYHFLLVVIVTATDNLSEAPEYRYSSIGVVDKYVDWNTVEQYMRNVITKYGLLGEQAINSSNPSIKMGIDGQTTKTQRRVVDGEEFNINETIDMNNNETELMLSFRNAQDELFGVRNHKTGRDRATRNISSSMGRAETGKSLYTRVNSGDTVGPVDYSSPEYTVGVQLQYNQRKMPSSVRLPEFQLYNEDDTYVDGENVPQLDMYTRDANIPKFNQVQGTRKAGRVVTANPRLEMRRMMAGDGK